MTPYIALATSLAAPIALILWLAWWPERAGRMLENDQEKLVRALRSIAANTCCDRCQEAALVAQAALREAGQ